LSHVSSSFCSGYFLDRVLLFSLGWPGLQSSYSIPPTVTGMTKGPHHTH
jgi:hypothetical protein